MIPQPFVSSVEGEDVRLDDALGLGWTLLARPGAAGLTPDIRDRWLATGAHIVELAGPSQQRAAERIVDRNDVLGPWMERRGVDALVLRPDRFVFAAGGADAHLPGPPPALQRRPKEVSV
jgi:3-(3-hydroxy-phenyl)propionate hydroxylase